MSGRTMNIGDSVVDADGVCWTVLNRPDGSGVCDGLFRREEFHRDPFHRDLHLSAGRPQRYGEHMRHPLVWRPS